MSATRTIEVFSAGCPACQEAIHLVNRLACPSCEVTVLDMRDAEVADRAKSLGVRCVPAVAIDGVLAECCGGRGPDEAALRAAGALLTGIDGILGGTYTNAFCPVRPPGHHACYSRAMGFCIFNNIAIGARYLKAVSYTHLTLPTN